MNPLLALILFVVSTAFAWRLSRYHDVMDSSLMGMLLNFYRYPGLYLAFMGFGLTVHSFLIALIQGSWWSVLIAWSMLAPVVLSAAILVGRIDKSRNSE